MKQLSDQVYTNRGTTDHSLFQVLYKHPSYEQLYNQLFEQLCAQIGEIYWVPRRESLWSQTSV